MRAHVAAVLLLAVTGCPTDRGTPGTPVPTPADHVLSQIHEECVGLARTDCVHARVACAKAAELFREARVPESDRQHASVLAARASCSDGR